MTKYPVTRVYDSNLPIVLMPSGAQGQLTFAVNGERFSFVMPRADFERLGRQIARLLSETAPPAQQEGSLPSNGK